MNGRFLLIALFVFIAAGCGYNMVRDEEKFQATGQYGELAKLGESKTAHSGKLSTTDLYPLCLSYSKLKNYSKLFPCIDNLEDNIRKGDDAVDVARDNAFLRFAGIVSSPFLGGTEALKPNVTPYPNIWRAQAYIELGEYNKAIEEAKKGYDRIPAGLPPQIKTELRIYALYTLSLAYALNKDEDHAGQYLKELENLPIPFVGSAMTAPEKQNAIAKVCIALKQYDKALEHLKDNWGAFRSLTNVLTGASFEGQSIYVFTELPQKFMLNKCLHETGKIEEAKAGYDALLKLPQTQDNGEILWMILFDRGRISESEGALKEATTYYRQAIDIIEQQRSTINTEASKIGFVGDKQAVYRYLIAALFTDRQYSSAFEYIERSKSRALVDTLATKKDFAVQTGNEKQIRELLAMTDKSEQEALVQDFHAKKDNTRSLIVKTKEQLQQQASELASLVSVTSVSVAEIQRLIPPDETLVEYYYTEKDLYAFVLTSQGLSAIRLESGNLTEEIKAFRQSLDNVSSASYEMLSRQLFNKLIKPVEISLSTRKLIIVPHGALHYLPFYALHDGKDYLIERYSIRMLPSASIINYLQRKKATKVGDILAFGNPDLGDPKYDLVYAQNEAIAVSKTRPRSKVFLRKEATETALIKYGAGFSYIHFATHGEFDADKPLNSALLLAMDTQSDGKLTVDKLYSMKLDADLITLSACETGLSKIANGDDLVGLTRGFLYAGSSSIVASLWKVDDLATAQLMTRFYREMEGTDKREALRTAQLETKKKYPHPYYWASFQLTGNAK
jgi:CHAT domain-containing protein